MYECLFCRLYCKKDTQIIWTKEEDNALIQYIITGHTLDDICSYMKMPTNMVEYRIIDNMSKYNNYEAVYHMGPGFKYRNYIEFIKKQYEYTSL